jgi:fluoroquinolone transport system ATP-binding protein
VAFIVDGSVRALDTPHRLIMQKGAAKLRYTYDQNGQEKAGETLLHETGSDDALLRLIKENRLTSIHSSEPTLNDLFVELTGRELA